MKKQIAFIFIITLFSDYTFAQTLKWAHGIGSDLGHDVGTSIKVDTSGNVFTTGYFSGTVDFDPGPGITNLVSAGEFDIFISKTDAYGRFVWAKGIGGTGYDRSYTLSLDASGNVYTAGSFQGTVDFDPGPGVSNLTSISGWNIFISKLDSSGNFMWAKDIVSSNVSEANFIVIDPSDNIYLTGYFIGTADFDPGAGIHNLTSVGGQDIFILKLNTLGSFTWAKSIGASGYEAGACCSIDASGNVYTTGSFYGTIDFDPGVGVYNLTSAGNYSIFISKLNSSGNFVWAKNLGGPGNVFGESIVSDALGNTYTTGYFNLMADFDPDSLGVFNMTSDNTDAFILKLDSSGNYVWAKKFHGWQDEFGYAITLDGSGNIYSTGYFDGIVDFDPRSGVYNLPGGGTFDAYISKLDSSGNFIWAGQLGGTNYTRGNAITTDASGNIYCTGEFNDTTDFDPGVGVFNQYATGTDLDIFISKIGPCMISYTRQPLSQTLNVNSNAIFIARSSTPTALYQWQEDDGSGFRNLINSGQYTGVTKDTLLISDVNYLQNNYRYRCIVTEGACSKISNIAFLNIYKTGIEEFLLKNNFVISPNPANDIITIHTSEAPVNINYLITDATGRKVLIGKLNNKTTTIDISSLTSGFYFVQVGEAGEETFKLLKK
jgi:hypothetical protein